MAAAVKSSKVVIAVITGIAALLATLAVVFWGSARAMPDEDRVREMLEDPRFDGIGAPASEGFYKQ